LLGLGWRILPRDRRFAFCREFAAQKAAQVAIIILLSKRRKMPVKMSRQNEVPR